MDALRFIRGYQLAKGYAPSFAEIRDALGYPGRSKSGVSQLLNGLEERGLMRRLHSRARAMETLADVPVPRAPDGAPLYFVGIGG
jgi:repressor LexA